MARQIGVQLHIDGMMYNRKCNTYHNTDSPVVVSGLKTHISNVLWITSEESSSKEEEERTGVYRSSSLSAILPQGNNKLDLN